MTCHLALVGTWHSIFFKKLNDFLFQLKQQYNSPQTIHEHSIKLLTLLFSFQVNIFAINPTIPITINSITMNSYTRDQTITFMIEYLRKMKQVCGEMHRTDERFNLAVKMNIVKYLAQQAFILSLKVSYFDEHSEYAIAAELLDDVYLRLSRSMISDSEMRESLDVLNERFKTIKVVCWKCKDRRRRRNKPVVVIPRVKEEECNLWTGSGSDSDSDPEYGSRVINPVPAPTPVKEYATHSYKKIDVPLIPEPPVKINAQMLEGETAEDFDLRKEFTAGFQRRINDFHRARALNKVELTPRLIEQFKSIIGMFDYTGNHAEYIAKTSSYRRIRKETGLSFMQVIILKCVSLSREVEVFYDQARRSNLRANPMLRDLKHRTLTKISETLDLLSNLYQEYPVESQSLESILDNPGSEE